MLSQKPPIRVVCPGRTYRIDSVFSVGHPAREMHDTFFFKTVSPSRS